MGIALLKKPSAGDLGVESCMERRHCHVCEEEKTLLITATLSLTAHTAFLGEGQKKSIYFLQHSNGFSMDPTGVFPMFLQKGIKSHQQPQRSQRLYLQTPPENTLCTCFLQRRHLLSSE